MTFIRTYLTRSREVLLEWITSPGAYAQFGLLVGAFLLALIVSRFLSRFLEKVVTPGQSDTSRWAALRRFGLLFLPLLLPLLAYGFTAGGEMVTRSLFGEGAVIAFGKRIFILLAAIALVNKVIYSSYLKMFGKYFLIPVCAMYALGILSPITEFLADHQLGIGAIKFSADKIVTAIVAGSFLFWLGRWSNTQGTQIIRERQDLRPSVRELASKTFELSVFGIIFLLLMSILELPIASLAVLGGAIGVGIGFGLQKIASNFISGIILLLEGQATVGDYVELDGGEAGTIVKMMARATILESFDGRWIVVPNEDFITTRVTNYSDSGSANRYSVDFSVAYDTDINRIPDIVSAAVAKHPEVLDTPEPPDCELSSFGDSGVEFCVEFWVNGLDDGKNKYSSDVMFLIWNALKDNDIAIPYPQREVRILGSKDIEQASD